MNFFDSDRSSVSQRIQNGLFANGLPAYVFDPATGGNVATFGPAVKKHQSEEVRDGTSQTISFFENCNNLNWREFSISDDSARFKLGCLWLYVGDTTSPGRPAAASVESMMKINYEKNIVGISSKRARPNSFHQGVVVSAMADGSTKVISEDIDYHVYQALMTPHTRQSDVPYNQYLLKEADFEL